MPTGVAPSWRFFIRGEPPNKNAALWVPKGYGSSHIHQTNYASR